MSVSTHFASTLQSEFAAPDPSAALTTSAAPAAKKSGDEWGYVVGATDEAGVQLLSIIKQ